jgi:hypothetical protein
MREKEAILMSEEKKRQGVTAPLAEQTAGGCANGIDRGVQSLVAEDNPDDFQIGADRKQTRDDAQ